MRVNLDTDPAVIGIASRLKIPELHVVGLLWKVWAWADQHTADGNAVSVTNVTLDRFTGVTGFANALRKVGWLAGKDNALTFPNFDRHNGASAKLRGKTAKRVANFRNAKSVTNVTHLPLPDKRREEKICTPTEYPEGLRSESFRKVWEDWEKHRKEIKKALTPTSRQEQLQNLAKMGEAKAIETIKHTIFKGWQGLKEPDNGTHQRSNAQSGRNTGTANEGRTSQYAGVGRS
jgi:hypothetical protein